MKCTISTALLKLKLDSLYFIGNDTEVVSGRQKLKQVSLLIICVAGFVTHIDPNTATNCLVLVIKAVVDNDPVP
ncbi:hypothetical protein Plhal304r1_c023g0079461 [Plasmopara halstedii]